ncbi:hypothetical protein F0M18_09775 [Pseudohalioglobus sediminis]|uniref:Uncharacterized protein n=1 Tax=Pseudohalioglobus sediminis TaxID=2606449 RepID=A0A5B0WZI5_9GAMM|nr:hypothetical protein [Pseudohalioglobus sediminis]KAA1191815.1 hypothetical protein F0M18_09775 [Pseudohalioglobus sediminis]
MRNLCYRMAGITVLAAVTASAPALADTTSATCEFYHKGDKKSEASGPCQFSQRQGYVDIRLRNGSQYNLSPHGEANHFRDQKGHKVKRRNDGDTQVYKWEERAIHVHFHGGSHSGHDYHSGHHSNGNTPQDLKDLVGARGGMAEDQLRNRGYVLANSSKSGKDVYSNWRHRHGGQCVSIHTVDGHYRSIVYAPQFDCE